jgi:hypothetical protein
MEMMQTPQFREAMSNPQTIQQILALSSAMGGPQGMPGMQGIGSQQNPMPNPQLLSLLSGMQQTNTAIGMNASQPVVNQEPPEVRFQTQLAQLIDMVLLID